MRDVKFMTAAEKETVLRAWKRFVKAVATGTMEQRRNAFTKALYHHLSQHCSFIAHYDRGGFFATYFGEPEDTAHFFTQFDRAKGCVSVEYGMTYWFTDQDYSDINNAIVDAAKPYLDRIYQQAQGGQRDLDVARASALLAKHGMAL